MKVCRNCGAPLDDNAQFCGECGTPVQNNSQNAESLNQSVQSQYVTQAQQPMNQGYQQSMQQGYMQQPMQQGSQQPMQQGYPQQIHQGYIQQPMQQSYQQSYQPGNAYISYEDAGWGFKILSFFFPLIGLILWIVKKDKEPVAAKTCLIWAGIGLGAGIIFSILMTIILIVAM